MFPRILALTLGTFAIGTDLFVIAGILPVIAKDMAVSVSTAGLLVTMFSITYALGAPFLAAITAALPRHQLLIVALAIFTLANGLAALSPNLGWLMIARIVAALAAAVFTPNASAIAASLASPEQRGRVLALVMTGLTLAIVLGLPMGTWIGSVFGWRATFWLVAGMGTLSIIGILLLVPSIPNPASVDWRDRVSLLRRPQIVAALVLTTLWTTGGFAVFTYIASVLHHVTHLDEIGISSLLFIFGLASVVGNYLGGYGADRWGPVLTISIGLGVLAADLFFLPWSATTALGAFFVMGIWGIAGWMLTPAQQHRLLALAPNVPGIILSLNGSAIYLGIGLGAFIGGWLLLFAPLSMLGWVGSGCQILALCLLWVSIIRARNRKQDV